MALSLGAGSVVDADVAEVLSADLPWDGLAGSSVLVTGASGMLPSYACYVLLGLNDLLGTGITVHGLVRNEAKARRILGPLLDRPDFRLIVADVATFTDGSTAFDHVVHGASAARPALHAADPVATIKANLLGTLNLLDLCVAGGARSFSLMSSAEVYGAQPEGTTLIAEDSYGGFDILNPRACYSEGKRAAETICAAYAKQFGIACTIPRFGHIYGPGMALDDGRVQADFAAAVIAGRDVTLNSAGLATRTYTYVSDAISGLFHALLKGESATAYNIADPAGLVSIRELARLFVAARPGKGLRLRFSNPADQSAFAASAAQGLSSARIEALGWRPRVALPEGIDRTLRYHEEAADASVA